VNVFGQFPDLRDTFRACHVLLSHMFPAFRGVGCNVKAPRYPAV
jgi:hypothetical protein